jgi:hypothetical protein
MNHWSHQATTTTRADHATSPLEPITQKYQSLETVTQQYQSLKPIMNNINHGSKSQYQLLGPIM